MQANLDANSKIVNLLEFGVKFIQLGMGKHSFVENYSSHPNLVNGFKELVYELHPKGVYFPKETITTDPTIYDDWIKGNGEIEENATMFYKVEMTVATI
ncbi:hypothetical protein QUB77_01775 [Microcoleus sp. AT9b-C3]